MKKIPCDDRTGTLLQHMMSHLLDTGRPFTDDPDAVLVASAQNGDLQAFEELVAKHQRRMVNVAYRLTGSYEDACEVVQDAFVSAYKNLAGFRRESKLSSWRTANTMNLAKNRLKRMIIRQTREPVSLDAPVRTDEGELLPDPPSKEPSALDRMEKQGATNAVRHCIQALEPDFRAVIVLRDLHDMAYEEIGAALHLAVGTVKSRLFRAREAVKECLKKALGSL